MCIVLRETEGAHALLAEHLCTSRQVGVLQNITQYGLGLQVLTFVVTTLCALASGKPSTKLWFSKARSQNIHFFSVNMLKADVM
jgi:hypothetical protein